MRIVIVGTGKVGTTLAEQLSMEDHDIFVIDQNQATVDHLVNTLDIMGVCGNGASYQVLLEENGKTLHHAIAMNDLYWNTLIGAAKPMPGILACLAALKDKGYILGIGTDMSIDYQLKKLVKLQMLPYFDFIVSSEEVNVEKPHAKLFACCAQKANVSIAECLFVGDSLKKDYHGSSAAGMQSLWYCPNPAVFEANPDIRKIAHFDELREMLLQQKG